VWALRRLEAAIYSSGGAEGGDAGDADPAWAPAGGRAPPERRGRGRRRAAQLGARWPARARAGPAAACTCGPPARDTLALTSTTKLLFTRRVVVVTQAVCYCAVPALQLELVLSREWAETRALLLLIQRNMRGFLLGVSILIEVS